MNKTSNIERITHTVKHVNIKIDIIISKLTRDRSVLREFVINKYTMRRNCDTVIHISVVLKNKNKVNNMVVLNQNGRYEFV